MKAYLEHANISVSDLTEGIKFFKTAFPEFRIRGRGATNQEWVHFGDDETYLAINQATVIGAGHAEHYIKTGVNHLGFVVEDAKGLARRMEKAGYQRSLPEQLEKSRIREYFLDRDGNEFEFVQYLSEEAEIRNEYL